MRTWLPVLAIALPACFAPPGPMERLSNSAYDCNIATRFNRMDVAVGYVDKLAQNDWLARHAKWGQHIRIVDVELAGMRMLTNETAEVSLGISWHRIDESVIRYSRINQHWKDDKDGWRLLDEMRVAGSPGLFDRETTSERREPDSAPPSVDMGQL